MKRKLLLPAILILLLCVFVTACTTPEEEEKVVIHIGVANFSKTVYYEKNPLSLQGAEITVTYSDGTTETVPVTEEMVSGYDKDQIGRQQLEITYKNKKTTLTVEVKKYVIQSITLEKRDAPNAPIDIDIFEGGVLDLSAYRLRLNYQEGHSAVIDIIDEDSMVSGFSRELAPGQHQLTLSYENHSTVFPITVIAKEIENITVLRDGKPAKSVYFVDEPFEPDGLKMTITYNDGSNRIIPYTAQNAADFKFNLDFSKPRSLCPVEVTYLDQYTAEFNVEVKTPACIGMSFEYTDSEGNLIDGRPKTRGVIINGVQQAPSELHEIIEGDDIDWASGTAMLHFEYGPGRVIRLDDNSVYGYRDSAAYSTDVPGNYTINLYYGNVSWRVALNIIVKAREELDLILYNTETVTGKNYVEGDRIIADHIKYNVLYNNGEYLFYSGSETAPAAVADCDYVTVDMLSGDSILIAEYIPGNGGAQNITYVFGKVEKILTIAVEPLAVISYIITPPVKDHYLTGTAFSAVEFDGTIYVGYNNNNVNILSFYDEGVTIEYYLDGTRVYNSFDTAGVYTARINYKNESGEFPVHIVDKLAVSMTLINAPVNNSFYNFNDINFSAMSLNVTYNDASTDVVPVTEQLLYNPDKMRPGYQEVVIKYMSLTVKFGVNIIGRKEVSIELKKAPKLTYLHGIDTELDIDGMVIIKKYNDGSTPGEVREFPSANWSFKITNPATGADDSLSTVGAKKVTVTYTKSAVALKLHYFIEVAAVTSIVFDDTQTGLEPVDYNGQSVNMLLITRRDELNVNGLKLTVYYDNRPEPVLIDLLPSYIDYDSNLDVYDVSDPENPVLITKRRLEIKYGGKVAYIWIHIVERALTSIEIHTMPSKLIYPEGMELDLSGGKIRRHFSDGTSDVMSMTNGSIVPTNYDTDPFSSLSGGSTVKTIPQTVSIVYKGKTASFNVTTFRKLKANENMNYLDAVSFYGAVKVPSIEIIETVPGFTLPGWTMDYQASDGQWIRIDRDAGQYPRLPGNYPVRVNIIGNEYYDDMTIEGGQIIIVKKIIEIRANDALKTYGDTDPALTYWTEGDIIEGGVVVGNSVLVWNNGVQDRLEVIVEREPGENVLFSDTGAIVGYTITCRLANPSPTNQNDRYIVDFKPGIFKIMQKVVTSPIQFGGNLGLKEDGIEKRITAYYVVDTVSYTIKKEDIIYTDSNGTVLPGAPVTQGSYTATISDNYIISGTRSIEFTIGPPN